MNDCFGKELTDWLNYPANSYLRLNQTLYLKNVSGKVEYRLEDDRWELLENYLKELKSTKLVTKGLNGLNIEMSLSKRTDPL